MEKYKFTEKTHRHELLVDGKWKRLTGCTTVLGVLAKPALIQWSADMACKYIKENYKGDKLDEILAEARIAHRKKKEEAGIKGTNIHAICEGIIKESIDTGFVTTTPKMRENPQIKHFLDWSLKNKVKFLESEKHIYSEKLFLGGIVDFICEIDGDVWLGDIKTSSGIYSEAVAQIAGYHIMLEEMGLYPNVKGYVVVNLRKDGTFEEKRSISNEDCKDFFLSALNIYRKKSKIDNLIK